MKHLENSDTLVMPEIPQQSHSQTQRDLRYILTQKCNYKCSFCHKEWCDGSEKNLLNADDYSFIFSTAKDALGINQVTLSGGEPMMRKDIWEITEKLHHSWAKTTMVSNWALIPRRPEVMKHIDVLNLSLHTTNQNLYTTLTWSSTKIEDLIDGIAHIHSQYPHLQIKLNSAIINGQNTPDSEDFARKLQLAEMYGWKLKYLELCGTDVPWFVDVKTFEKDLLNLGFTSGSYNARQNLYKKDGAEIITGRVFCSQAKQTADPQWYCKRNNDIYITPDGFLSTCPVNIKKISAYESILSRNEWKLALLLQESIDPNTKYQCPFSS